MRIIIFLFFATCLEVSATGYSQRVTLAQNDVSLKKVFKEIERQSGYNFFYKDKLLRQAKEVSIHVDNVSVEEALNVCFKNQSLYYTVLDKIIIIKAKKQSSVLTEAIAIIPDEPLNIINGTVKDDKGNPLEGVSVVVKGTRKGISTNASGNFSIDANSGDVLEFTIVGYQKKIITVGQGNHINVVLNIEVSVGDEVVVVGYGTQKRKSLTGAVSSVNASELKNETSANIVSRMQGKAAGVSIINSYVPGGDAVINIRGMGTINNNNPLFVIDGVPTKSGMSQINPNEVESISVLKDATSAAIYGARGANGVIIITTKRGSAGKPKVSFTARYGVNIPANPYELLNTQEYGEYLWLEAKNRGVSPSSSLYGSGVSPVIPDYLIPVGKMEGDPLTDPSLYNHQPGADFYNITKANKTGTNWRNEILRNAPLNEYNVAFSGGAEKGTYALNFGYSTEDGIVKQTSFDRYSIRANSDLKVNSWLKIGESLSLTYSNFKGSYSNSSAGSVFGQVYRMPSIIPVYDIMGNFAGTKGTGLSNWSNPVAIITRAKDNFQKDLRGIGNGYADIKIFKDLNFNSLFGFDYRVFNGKSLARIDPESQQAIANAKVDMSNSYTIQWNWANTLNYRKLLGQHRINVLVGSEAVSSNVNGLAASRSNYFSENVDYMLLNAGEQSQINSGGASETLTLSYFSRINYDFNGKYLAELTFRRDGSSRFGANNRWGNFPSASVGWMISDETFMSGTKNIVNNLKLRVGYGVSGNDEIGDYNGFSTFSANPGYSYYSIDGNPTGITTGFYASKIGNPNAKWETTNTMNIGIDLTTLDNTLTVILDIWQRKTNDMLFRVAIPNVAGAATAPSVNIGNMDNKGFDLSLNYANKAMGGNLTYDIGLTLSHYKNKIVKISDKENEFIGGGYTRATKGTSYPEFYGLIVDGIFQDAAEAASYPASYGNYNLPGHYKFRDVNGDGVINDLDRTYIGSPHPKFTAGLNVGIGYKAFNLNAFLYSSYGNKIANGVKGMIDYVSSVGNRSKDLLYRSWGSPYLANNSDAILPLADGALASAYPSTAFLENGSFLRLKTLQVSYTLPASINQKLAIKGLQVYVQGTNLVTITKYKGLEPEVYGSGMSLGIDNSQWPSSRQMVFGINLDF